MHLSKIFLRSVFIFLTFFLFSTPTFAVGVQGGTLVATVNISDAKITSQDGNTFNIAFSLTNGDGAQNGVLYGVQLFSETPKGKFIVDEKIFDEKLDLPENSSFRKGISYTPPSTLEGTYQLLLVSKNSDGFPFAFYPLGKVTITKTAKGVQIAPESCLLKTDKNTPAFPISKMAILGIGAPQSIELSCSVSNSDSSSVSAIPVFKTNLQDSFGDIVEVTGSVMDPVSFKAGEKKTVSLKVPLATKPQRYNATLSFNVAGVASNSVSFRYLVSGPSATILNLSLDKDYYKRGETAALSIVWLNLSGKTSIEATLKSKYGMKCAKPIEKEFTSDTNEVLFPISSACRDPHVSVSIKDDKGTVLDQKEFSVKTSSAETENKTLFIVIVALALLAIAMFYIKKNKKDQNPSNITNNILPIIILAGLGSFIPMQVAHADTYTSGPGGSVLTVVNVSPTSYAPNADIGLDYYIKNNYTSSLPITFKAINDIGLGASNPSHVYIPQPTTFAPGQETGGGFPIVDTLTFDAPGSNGTYNITFETGVDDPSAIYVKVETIDNNTWYTGPNYCDSGWNNPPGYVDFYHNTLTERASFFSDPAGTIPLDVTGLNLNLKQGAYWTSCSGGSCQCNSPESGNLNNPVASGTYYDYTGYSIEEEFTQQYGSSSCNTQTICSVLGYATFDGSSMPVPYYFLPPPPQASISALPSHIYTGESSQISWSSNYATTCTSSDFATGGVISGVVTVYPPTTTTYSVTCTSAVGSDAKSVTVTDMGSPPEYCFVYPGVNINCSAPSTCDKDPINGDPYQLCVL